MTDEPDTDRFREFFRYLEEEPDQPMLPFEAEDPLYWERLDLPRPPWRGKRVA